MSDNDRAFVYDGTSPAAAEMFWRISLLGMTYQIVSSTEI
jgi:hypothetical protein